MTPKVVVAGNSQSGKNITSLLSGNVWSSLQGT